MAGYSKENERQNQALKSILKGETPEKRIFIAQEDLDFKKKVKEEAKQEQKRIDERLEVTKEARMPWFCPKCDKVMKKNIDDKMWRLYGHCSNCQVEFENRLAIDGKYNEWVKSVERENKLAWIRDQRETINEFKKQDTVEFFQQIRPDGYSLDTEKWEIDTSKIMKQADEYLEYLQKMEDTLQNE